MVIQHQAFVSSFISSTNVGLQTNQNVKTEIFQFIVHLFETLLFPFSLSIHIIYIFVYLNRWT